MRAGTDLPGEPAGSGPLVRPWTPRTLGEALGRRFLRRHKPQPAPDQPLGAEQRVAGPPPSRKRQWRPVLTLLGRVILVPVLLGPPAGLVWWFVAPRPRMLLTSNVPVYANPEPQAPIAADGWFAVITAVTAVLSGVLVFLLTRRRLHDRTHEIAALVGLAAGGLGGSLAAWGSGWAVAFAAYRERLRTHSAGTEVAGSLQVHATGVIVVLPLLAVVFFTALLAVRACRHSE